MRVKIIFFLFWIISSGRGQTFTNFEYFFNNDPGVNSGSQISGFPSGGDISFFTVIQVPSNLPSGLSFLNIRGKQTSSSLPIFTDRWSNVFKMPFYIFDNSGNTNDTDGINKISLQFRNNTFVSNEQYFDVSLNSNNQYVTPVNVPNVLNFGIYDMIVKSRSNRGHWSVSNVSPFLIFPGTNNTSNNSNIDKIEYFFNNDPGMGNGLIVSCSFNNNTSIIPISISPSLNAGINFLCFRVRNSMGHWSQTYAQAILVWNSSVNRSNSPIVKIEYFVDTDPGEDNGTNIVFAPNPSENVTISNFIDLSGLFQGEHTINYRCKNTMGYWSEIKSSKVNVSCQNGVILYTKQNGEWNIPSTWECGRIPTATDPVFIKSGHRINVISGVNANAKTITIENGSVFNTQSGAILNVKF